MGEPILIKDVAEQMIRFYGFEPDVEIPIIYTGIRPGEKFLEKLWRNDDVVEPSATERVNILKNRSNQTVKTNELLDKLHPVCYLNSSNKDMFRNRHLLRNILKEYIPTVERPENEPNTDFIPFALPSIGEEEKNAVMDVLDSGWLTTGRKSAELEKRFSEITGAEYALSVNSATSGLHLVLESFGIKDGDQSTYNTLYICFDCRSNTLYGC